MKPHKISTHSAHSNNFYFHFFYPLSDWVEILWGFTKLFFKQMLKISAFYLEKQKSFIPPKKFDLGREFQQMAFAVLIFSEGFAWAGERLFANKINPKKKGFQCSLTHIFQHFPISVLPLCPIITFYSCFRNCPGFLIFIAKFDRFSTMWAVLLCCLHEKAQTSATLE